MCVCCVWAGSKGYTFAVWLRLETVQKGLAAGGRSLYSLLVRSRDSSVKGIAAAFKGELCIFKAWQNHFRS